MKISRGLLSFKIFAFFLKELKYVYQLFNILTPLSYYLQILASLLSAGVKKLKQFKQGYV